MNRGPKAARVGDASVVVSGQLTQDQIYAEARAASLLTAAPQEVLVLREGFTGFQQKFRVRLLIA
jgi:hypothetical protein